MTPELTLDPKNWEDLRILGHKMLDEMVEHLKSIRQQPVWQQVPEEVKAKFKMPIPVEPQDRKNIYQEFKDLILPYPLGNIHPRFWGWVAGSGTPFGMLAEMLTATMNTNVAGEEQIANYVETQVLNWTKELLGYNLDASGLLVSGASIANLIGLTVARNTKADYDIIKNGVQAKEKDLLFYGSTEMHGSIDKSIQLLGLGLNSLKKIPVNKQFKIDLAVLKETIKADLKAGNQPVCIIGNIGTVNTGAVDDISGLAEIAQQFDLWFHIDGAFGVWCKISPESKNTVEGLEKADSIAFDFHKWMYINYDVGCVLVKNKKFHSEAFNFIGDYTGRLKRGTGSSEIRFSDYGPQLSRGFRALKVWMSIKEHGIDKLGTIIEQNIQQARYLTKLIENDKRLEILAPTEINIVNFRYNDGSIDINALNKLNEELLFQLQERGIAVPSNTMINGNFAIRVAIVNHRSVKEDFKLLVNSVLEIGKKISKKNFRF
ncbi:MAG: pyridoxal phosphate-dependent decarboxylase family protein [Promethearchaeota archaeon]|jgi:glutamate/tyrosine decarboxylase-like PLP-dependent enzyme